DDAGAADPGDENAVRFGERGRRRLQQIRQPVLSVIGLGRGSEAAAMHRDKARAETCDAGVILVAARLVDRALAAKLGLDRYHRDAIRGARAIAAALANQIVDKDALRRVGEAAALAAAALLGGASLVVNDRGDAGDRTQFALHRIETIAVA